MKIYKTRVLAVLLFISAWSCMPLKADVQPLLEELKLEARKSHSDTLLVTQHGKVLAEYYTDEGLHPIELMSAFKSLVALAIGRLIFVGEIESLDQPVADFYPEWRQGKKKLITIRHLLNHTSGLQNVANAGDEIYPTPDAIKLALAAELTTDTGTAFSYNNKATNLLAGIIHQASGLRMDLYLTKEFFVPMGIEHYKFYYDPSGNPHAMAGLQLLAKDFAKFGELILNKGQWNKQQLLELEFLDEMLAQGQSFSEKAGLLWWRLPGQGNKPDSYYADGFLGQYMVIVPEKGLVAIRQIKQSPAYQQSTDGFAHFKHLVAELAAELPDGTP